MEIINNTELDTKRLEAMFRRAVDGWTAPVLKVCVRHSRSAIYSGTFISHTPRIFINIGKKNRYPMKIETGIAKARTIGSSWWKPSYHIKAENPYHVALFVFLHEFYHYLIHRARRNSHRKESMCDRFAVRYLINQCRMTVYDNANNPVAPNVWLFQDLEGFVANKKTITTAIKAARRPR